jgi:hypothetical protein
MTTWPRFASFVRLRDDNTTSRKFCPWRSGARVWRDVPGCGLRHLRMSPVRACPCACASRAYWSCYQVKNLPRRTSHPKVAALATGDPVLATTASDIEKRPAESDQLGAFGTGYLILSFSSQSP